MEFKIVLSLVIAFFAIVVFAINFFVIKKKNKTGRNSISGNGNTQQNGEGNTAVSVGSIINNYELTTIPDNTKTSGELTIDRIKSELRVIFVDDKRFNVVELLKKNGWKQVYYKRDIMDIDAVDVREAHVLFLDINGVGVAMGFHNQGMGLCGALKRKYGDKKRVVLYSGETSGDIFDSDARLADDTLKKDSDLYQFTALMERYGKELL